MEKLILQMPPFAEIQKQITILKSTFTKEGLEEYIKVIIEGTYTPKPEPEPEPEPEPVQEPKIFFNDLGKTQMIEAYQNVADIVESWADRFKKTPRSDYVSYYHLNPISNTRAWTVGGENNYYFQDELCKALSSKSLETFSKMGLYKNDKESGKKNGKSILTLSGFYESGKITPYEQIKQQLNNNTTLERIINDYIFK